MTTTTAAPPSRRITQRVVAAAAGSAVIGWVGWYVVGGLVYLWILVALIAVASVAIAAVDARTLKLPDRLTMPLAAAAAVQLAIAATLSPQVLLPALIATAVTFVAYTAMALAGWTGFGDAKFAAGLALAVSVVAGSFAIAIVPLALVIASVRHLVRRGGKRAHGPDLAAAAIVVSVAVATVISVAAPITAASAA